MPLSFSPTEAAALLFGGAVAAGLGAIDDLFDLRARYSSWVRSPWRCGAVALGITIDFVANPFGGRRSASRAGRGRCRT